MPDASNIDIDSKYIDAAAKMTKTITYRLAAAFIIDRNFPNEDDLPQIVPPPFNNFGHQLLLDYALLVKIIWQVIGDIQRAVKKRTRIITVLRILSILFFTTLFICFYFLLNAVHFGSTIATIKVAILSVMFFVVTLLLTRHQQKKRQKQIAEIRAEAIGNLLQEQWELRIDDDLTQAIEEQLRVSVGDGVLRTDKIPVLTVVDNRRPFPGYGHLQAENLFVCAPKTSKRWSQQSRSRHVRGSSIRSIKQRATRKLSHPTENDDPVSDLEQIKEAVDEALRHFIAKDEIHYVNIGHVVALHGNSLYLTDRNSQINAWLGEYKIPKLWLCKDEFDAIDEDGSQDESLRIYSAIQVLFPRYDTAATFFVRLFLAENSASCHIAVTSMGPINFHNTFFRRRLLKYRLDREREEQEDGSYLQGINETDALPHSMKLLRFVREASQNAADFQAERNFKEITALDYFAIEEEAKELYSHGEFVKTGKASVIWPGIYFPARTIRERNSLTFTNDFFGKTEAVASIKSLYNQIGRAVIDSFADLGFDVTDYRGKDGNYTINADKIEIGKITETIISNSTTGHIGIGDSNQVGNNNLMGDSNQINKTREEDKVSEDETNTTEGSVDDH